MPEGAKEAFLEIALSGVMVSQAAGPVDMIIGRDNPEWIPVPVQEEPYERFTLMWTSLSPHCILRDNEGVPRQPFSPPPHIARLSHRLRLRYQD